MKSVAVIATLAVTGANAFPKMMMDRRQVPSPLPSDFDESNTGPIKSTTFNAVDQYVDVTPNGPNPFVAPGLGDLRGPCPGLNAAANHGFMPHNGKATILQTVDGLGRAYNMAPDLAAALAVVGIALTGDYLTETWSIGGAFDTVLGGLGLLSNPGGISNSHNKYETDSSPGRGDAYLHNGDAVSLNKQNFQAMLDSADPDGTYSLQGLRLHAKKVRDFSIANNPYVFYAPFAGLVSTAAEEFIINLMSNHSDAQPSGFLTSDVLKTFFSVSGEGDNMHYKPGNEQIPQNWYRRPSSNMYLAALNGADDVISLLAHPELASIGGNMGKVNTFAPIDIGDLSGGLYNSQNILEGNNLGCFAFQFAEAFIPDQAAGIVGDIAALTGWLAKQLGPLYSKLGCPAIGSFNQGLLTKYPGYHYNPKGEEFGVPF